MRDPIDNDDKKSSINLIDFKKVYSKKLISSKIANTYVKKFNKQHSNTNNQLNLLRDKIEFNNDMSFLTNENLKQSDTDFVHEKWYFDAFKNWNI